MLISAKTIILIAAISGMIAVLLGAFGAHALQGTLPENLFRAYKTGVSYQLFHTLALLALAILCLQAGSHYWWQLAALAMVIGILLFSGSLYALALGAPKIVGPLTPLGGLAFIVGWLCIVIGAVKLEAFPN
jgi:uncharacterized membrane protein YgdD (TMEM256/DUF423 family)